MTAKTIDELRRSLKNPSRAARNAVPLFAELIEPARITDEDQQCEGIGKLIVAYVLRYETGSFPFGWTNAACIAMLDAGFHPPAPRTISGIAWEIKNRRSIRLKHARIDIEKLEQAARIMNGEEE